MGLIQHINGVEYRIKILNFTLRLSKIYNLLDSRERKMFMFQLNKFESGNVTIYLRLFYRYSLTLYGIKVKEGKRFFFGNIEQ